MAIEPLPAGLVEALEARPDSEHIQTHISHVFLRGERVEKLHKAVDLGFIDLGTRARRNADCLAEVRLNRRLAPDVYLGVSPIRHDGTGFTLGTIGDSIDDALEHCVVMRRLPEGRDALTLLEAGTLEPAQLDAVAARVAEFHAGQGLGRPAPFSADEWWQCCTGPTRECFESLASSGADAVDARVLADTAAAWETAAHAHAPDFERRRLEGRAVDGHGDLHLQHVWFEGDGAPLVIDCLEFRDDLRRIDAACDVAFLAMDLAYRGREDLAERFLRRYARDGDDFDLYRVVDVFVGYRAAVRAKVAAIAAGESEIGADQRRAAAASAERHLEQARRAVAPRGEAAVIAVSGIVGTGKSSAAELLSDARRGVIIATDRVRKRIARPGSGESLYTPERIDAAYTAMLERAAPVLESGRPVVLDATFARQRHREAARALARRHGAPFRFVETRCAADEARRRLTRRSARGDDPSDAGPERYDASAAEYEPVSGLAPEEHIVVATDRPDWREALAHER